MWGSFLVHKSILDHNILLDGGELPHGAGGVSLQEAGLLLGQGRLELGQGQEELSLLLDEELTGHLAHDVVPLDVGQLVPQVVGLGAGEQPQDLWGPEGLGHGGLDGELHGGHRVEQAQVPAVQLQQALTEFLQLSTNLNIG